MKYTDRLFVFILLSLLSPIIHAQENTTAKTLLWRISGNGLTKTSYLFGTMHLQDKRIFYFTDSLYSYLESAEGFAMEVHPDSIMQATIEYADKKHRQDLVRDKLSKSDYEKLKVKLKKELDVEADKLTVRDAYLLKDRLGRPEAKPDDMQTIVDLYLYGIAQNQGKILTGLEKVSDQINLFDDFGNDFDVKSLMKDLDKEKEFTEHMINVYQDQDLEKIKDITSVMPADKEDKLLTRRNEIMAKKMDSLMREHSFFVAVGAAHLPGDKGIIELLRKKGYLVSPVFSNNKIDPTGYVKKNTSKWVDVSEPDQGYSLKMPGKPSPVSMGEGDLKMNMFLDLLTNEVYFVGFLRPAISINHGNADSLLYAMAEASAKESKGKILSSKRSQGQGFEVLEVIIHNIPRALFMRVQYLGMGKRVYLISVGAQQQSAINTPKADEYFRSFKILDISNPNWKQYPFEKEAFSAGFPSAPDVNRIQEEDSTMTAYKYVSVDDNSGCTYLIVTAHANPGYYFVDDSTLFKAYLQNFVANKGKILTEIPIKFDGYPAEDFKVDLGNNIVTKGRMINRGNRTYKILVFYDPANVDDDSAAHFINSFKFSSMVSREWKLHEVPGEGITLWSPAEFVADKKDEEARQLKNRWVSWHSYDSSFLMNHNVNYRELSPYSWSGNDTAYLKLWMHNLKNGNEDLLDHHFFKNGLLTGIEYSLKKENADMISKSRLILNGNRIYWIEHTMAAIDINSSEAEKFFEKIQFQKEDRCFIFDNNATKLFSDLHSTDSAKYSAAYGFLTGSEFLPDKTDLPPLLSQAVSQFPKDTVHYQSVNEKLFFTIKNIADSSHIDLLSSQYKLIHGVQEEYKLDILEILAKIKTEKSYKTIAELLEKSPPTDGNAFSFSYSLKDSLQLARSILPTLLKFASDTVMGKHLFSLYVNLLNKNLVQLEDLKPYENNFHQLLQFILKKQRNLANYDYFSFAMYDAMDLLGKFNDNSSNALLQDFTIGTPSDNLYKATMVLLKNNHAVAPSTLEKIASDKSSRMELYISLGKIKKQNLFPKKYLTQRYFAESYLSDAMDDEQPGSIQFIGEKIVSFKGKKQKFFLYKICLEDDAQKQYYLGISGPYGINSTNVLLDDSVAGYYSDEEFDPKNLLSQLNNYLKRRENEN